MPSRFLPGLGGVWRSPAIGEPIEEIVVQRPLDRVLAFTGYSIDDIVNDPIAKNAVFGYFKLARFISRQCEIVDLETQWNS